MRPLFLNSNDGLKPASQFAPERGLDLLKILSHDLRGSLVSISAVLHMLNRSHLEKADHLVETKLEELIDKIGNISSMLEESLHMALVLDEDNQSGHNLVDFNKDIIEIVKQEFVSEISKKKLTIKTLLDPMTGFQIPARINKTVLKMIFRNLFGNAVKHCDFGGTIEIRIKHGNQFFLLKIYNTGRPITEELQPKLFLKPLPPKDREEKNSDGMGLGLYLAKRIMQTQGGEIWYEPEEQGAPFVLAIPVETGITSFKSYSQGSLFF
jgi:signal transduction histidine kinase